MARFGAGAAPKCFACGKSVYAAEEIKGPNGNSWHNTCFCCRGCGKSLRGGEWKAKEGQPLCNACNRKELTPFAQIATASASHADHQDSAPTSPDRQDVAAEGEEKVVSLKERMAALKASMGDKGAEEPAPQKPSGGVRKSFGTELTIRCVACAKSVYKAEEIKGPEGKSWHAMCFCCKICGKSMRGGQWSNLEGSPACPACIGKLNNPARAGAANVSASAAGAGNPEKADSGESPRISVSERKSQLQQSLGATGTFKASDANALAAQAASDAVSARTAAEKAASGVAAEREAAEAAKAAKAAADEEAERAAADAVAKRAAAQAGAELAAEAAAGAQSAEETAAAEAKHIIAREEADRAEVQADAARAAQGLAAAEEERREAERVAAEAEAAQAAQAAADAEAAKAEMERMAADATAAEETGAGQVEEEEESGGGACGNYTLNLQGANFGDCKCGFAKGAHKQFANQVDSAPAPRKSQASESRKSWAVSASGFAPAPRAGDDAAPSTGQHCGNYRIDLSGKNFGDCVCGFSKASHETKAAGIEEDAGAAANTGEEVAPEGEPCDNYRLDLKGKNFGDCKCGWAKAAHEAK